MQHPGFFERAGPFLLADLAARLGAELAPGADGALPIEDVRPLSDAGPAHISFVDNRKYMGALEQTKAAACLVAPPFATRVPKGTAAVLTRAPYRAFALALQAFYPESLTPKAARFAASDCPGLVHPSAVIEDGALIEPGAVVGREARIGSGTVVAAGAVVGYRVHVGRHCYIGSCATVLHAIVGDKVYLHPGVRIGQDGFGFAMSAQGHLKVPQIGRVVIHDDVEIGANTAIDRGALNDTVIGQGTRIDNLVQIGHNVIIGRHCVIVGQVGIAGSTTLGDFVVMGGHSGAAGHVTIGTGAQIAGASHVKDDVPAGARMGGTPARPLRQYGREIAALARLARGGGSSADAPDDAG